MLQLKMVQTIAMPADEPQLTPKQLAKYKQLADLGEEMRQLYAQTTKFLEDFGNYKAVPCKRKRNSFICNHDSKKLYTTMYRLEWNNFNICNSAGWCVWSDLENAVWLLNKSSTSGMLLLDGEEHSSYDLVSLQKLHSDHTETLVSLDNQSEMTEGDLALLTAWAQRYKTWVNATRPHVDTKKVNRFLKDINHLEQQASLQLEELFMR